MIRLMETINNYGNNLKKTEKEIGLNSLLNNHLISNLDNLSYAINKIKKNKYDISQLPISAENLHKDIYEKINMHFNIGLGKKEVFSTKLNDSISGIVKSSDGEFHILVNEAIANFNPDNEKYIRFCERNFYKFITPEDLFSNIVAHEYGHIIFKELLEKPLEKAINNGSMHLFSIPIELNEAFAYFIGDIITGIESPIEDLLSESREKGIKINNVLSIYEELKRLYENGKDEILKIDNLKKIAINHLYIEKNNDFDLSDFQKRFLNYLNK